MNTFMMVAQSVVDKCPTDDACTHGVTKNLAIALGICVGLWLLSQLFGGGKKK